MNKLRNSTHETFAAFTCSIPWQLKRRPWRNEAIGFFLGILMVMSVKPTLTDKLLKVNSPLKTIFSVIEDQCSGGQWSSKWGRQHFKLHGHVKLVNKQPSDFWFHQVLRCFTVVSSHFWTFPKCLSALETTTNNQEVKRSLHRLQNMNNWSKYYICTCLTCRSLA